MSKYLRLSKGYGMTKTIFIFLICLLATSACQEEEQREPLPDPQLDDVRPSYGLVGDTVKLSGIRFLADSSSNAVAFGGKTARVLSVSGDTVLNVIVPQGALTGAVTVGNSSTSITGPVFTIVSNRNQPLITSVSSQNLEIGEVLVITGGNFIETSKADSSVNKVLIGNKRLSIINVTTTEITAVVPAGSTGNNLELIVNTAGTNSNAITVNVNGFAGTLFWTLIPYNNVPNDNVHQLISKVAATGSAIVNSRASTAISDGQSLLENELRYSLSGPKTFSATANLLYYVRTDREDSLWSLSPPEFNKFKKILSNQESGGTIMSASALGVRESTQEVFYAYYGTSINKGSEFFGYTDTGNIEAMVGGVDALYLLVREYSTGFLALKKILYTAPNGGLAEGVDLSMLPLPIAGGQGIVSMHYSTLQKSVYMAVEVEGYQPLHLYQFKETDESLTLLANNLPPFFYGQSKFTLLDAPSGPKFYGIGAMYEDGYQTAGNMNLYMVNLKANSTNRYGAIPLYRDILKLPGRAETYTSFDPLFGGVDFLFVGNN